MKDNVKFLLADLYCSLFKVGYIKYMPGTFGSFIGLIIGILIKTYLSIWIYIFFTLIIIFLGIIAIKFYQTKKGKEDRSEIIIDEVIGQQIPIIIFDLSITNIVLGFLLFRFFDIVKIYPANYIDKNYTGSFGIIADDIVAGLQASLIIYFIILLL